MGIKVRTSHMEFRLFLFLGVVIIGIVVTSQLFISKQTTQVQNGNEQTAQPTQKEEIVITEGEDTKDWKIYRHKKMGIAIKYPNDVIIASESDESVVFTKEEYWPGRGMYPFADLQILDRDVEDNEPISALKNETPGGPAARKAEYIPARINNAYGIKTTSGFGSDYNFYLNDMNKRGRVLRVSASTDKAGVDLSDFVKMLSTFKFER